MITTINEFKKVLALQKLNKINEGGGSGIKFECDLNTTYDIFLNKNNGKFETTVDSVEFDFDSFNAEGYDDGGKEFKPELLKWKLPNIKVEEILNISFDYEDDDYGYNLKDGLITIEQLYNAINEEIKIQVYVDYEYSELIFGGYSRGQLEDGSVIFDNDSANVYEYEIVISTNNAVDDIVINLDNESLENFIETNSPICKADEGFGVFYNDVFNYNSIEYTEKTFVSELKDGEEYAITKLKDYFDFDDNKAIEYINNLDINNIPSELQEKISNDDELITKYHEWWLSDLDMYKA